MNAEDWREKSREPNIEKEARISMIKYMLVIVVLMQSSRGEDRPRAIRNELQDHLEGLRKILRREPGNWSFPGKISLPSGEMNASYAWDCQGVFAEALNHTLHLLKSNSTSVDVWLIQLKENTKLLFLSQPQTNRTCPMDVKIFKPALLWRFIDFLRRLNEYNPELQ